MKLKINGIEIEGTADEVADFVALGGVRRLTSAGVAIVTLHTVDPGRCIPTIKEVRTAFDLGLKDAKTHVVDTVRDRCVPVTFPPIPVEKAKAFCAAVEALGGSATFYEM